MKRGVLLSGIALIILLAMPAMAAADSYVYPTFNVSPSSIPQNGLTNVILETATSSTVPSGSGNWICTATGVLETTQGQVIGTCALPFVPPGPACDNSNPNYAFDSYTVTQLKVTTPNDPTNPDVYMLGTTSGPGITSSPIVVTSATINVPFGPAATGGSPFTINGVSYEWWRISSNGSPVNPNQNIVSNPSPGPTSLPGAYRIDIEGTMQCGSSQSKFDNNFFFDIGIQVTTPEFGSMLAVVAFGAAGLLVFRKKFAGLSAHL